MLFWFVSRYVLQHSLVQAESVTYYLKAPVLRHKVFKPSYSCISSIRTYFSSLSAPVQDDELIVVGDRIFTDVVMANRMARRRPSSKPASDPPGKPEKSLEKQHSLPMSEHVELQKARVGPLSVWTTGVWERESMPMRYLETAFMQAICRYVVKDNGVTVRGGEASKFLKPEIVPEEVLKTERVSILRKLWSRIRRT